MCKFQIACIGRCKTICQPCSAISSLGASIEYPGRSIKVGASIRIPRQIMIRKVGAALEYPGRSVKVGASIRIPSIRIPRQINKGGCRIPRQINIKGGCQH